MHFHQQKISMELDECQKICTFQFVIYNGKKNNNNKKHAISLKYLTRIQMDSVIISKMM